MSMELMVQAMKVKVGNPLRKLVLLKLADNASDQGECWPSYQHIADQCEISRRSVMNHVAALCESGLMRKEDQIGAKGNGSNFYRLTLSGANTSARVVQEIHQDGEANSPGLVQEIHQIVQHVHQGIVKEIHPESVTLLNQSKNQKIILVRMLRSPTGRFQKQNF